MQAKGDDTVRTKTKLLTSLVALVALSILMASLAGSPASGAPEMPRYGGVYIKNNIYTEPLSMDPIFALGAPTIMVQMNIFDGLVRVDPNRNIVAPDIAERWTHSPDAKTFTFYLRKGVLDRLCSPGSSESGPAVFPMTKGGFFGDE